MKSSSPSICFISATVARGCSPLDISSRMSFFSTPPAYSSSRQARTDIFLCDVGWQPPFTMSGMTITAVLPGAASSRSAGMPIGLRMLSSVAA